MSVALVSDVHTNVEAWEAVLKDLRRQGARQIWGLGDWLGRQESDPIKFWFRLVAAQDVGGFIKYPDSCGVIGNHDLALLARDDRELISLYSRFPYSDDAKRAIRYQRDMVIGQSKVWKEQFRPWLEAQPHVLSPQPGIYLAHGGFPEMSEIDEAAHWYTPDTHPHERSWPALQAWPDGGISVGDSSRFVHCPHGEWAPPVLIITGNTHKQAVWYRGEQRPNGRWPLVPELNKGGIPWSVIQECIRQQAAVDWPVKLQPMSQMPIWINPGSVGQPRDSAGIHWAQYALLDWQGTNGTLRLRWVPYEND
jgi:hypothetical protein